MGYLLGLAQTKTYLHAGWRMCALDALHTFHECKGSSGWAVRLVLRTQPQPPCACAAPALALHTAVELDCPPRPPHSRYCRRRLQQRGMQQDLSWEHAAELYEDVLVQAKFQW